MHNFGVGTVPGPTAAQVACLFATRSVWLRVDFRESHRHLPGSLVNHEMLVRPQPVISEIEAGFKDECWLGPALIKDVGCEIEFLARYADEESALNIQARVISLATPREAQE